MKEVSGLLNTVRQAGYSVMSISNMHRAVSDGKSSGLDGKKIQKGVYLAAEVLVYLPVGIGADAIDGDAE